MTDARTTQLVVEEWAGGAAAQVSQLVVEQWGSVPVITVRAIVSFVAAEQWAVVAAASSAAQARAAILA